MATKKTAKDVYTASIKVLGRTYTAEGASVKEAIELLNVGNVAKGMSLLSVSKGDVKREKVLNTVQTSRLFSPSRVVREIALKNTIILFGF